MFVVVCCIGRALSLDGRRCFEFRASQIDAIMNEERIPASFREMPAHVSFRVDYSVFDEIAHDPSSELSSVLPTTQPPTPSQSDDDCDDSSPPAPAGLHSAQSSSAVMGEAQSVLPSAKSSPTSSLVSTLMSSRMSSSLTASSSTSSFECSSTTPLISTLMSSRMSSSLTASSSSSQRQPNLMRFSSSLFQPHRDDEFFRNYKVTPRRRFVPPEVTSPASSDTVVDQIDEEPEVLSQHNSRRCTPQAVRDRSRSPHRSDSPIQFAQDPLSPMLGRISASRSPIDLHLHLNAKYDMAPHRSLRVPVIDFVADSDDSDEVVGTEAQIAGAFPLPVDGSDDEVPETQVPDVSGVERGPDVSAAVDEEEDGDSDGDDESYHAMSQKSFSSLSFDFESQ